jgi:hypothetical protein
VFGKPEGFYDERYVRACTGRMADFGHTVTYIHDEDMPEALRYRGNWGMLSLYNPDLDIDTDGVIYAQGIDTVFLKDPENIRAALDEVGETGVDIVGSVCASDGKFNTMGLRIVRGSPGAMAIWEAAKEHDFFRPRGLYVGAGGDRLVEHKAVRRFAGQHTGTMRTGLVQSYKAHIGKFPRRYMGEPRIEDITALAFHGHPNPHEVLEGDWPLQDLIMEHWGRHAGY